MAEVHGNRTHPPARHRCTGFEDQEAHQAPWHFQICPYCRTAEPSLQAVLSRAIFRAEPLRRHSPVTALFLCSSCLAAFPASLECLIHLFPSGVPLVTGARREIAGRDAPNAASSCPDGTCYFTAHAFVLISTIDWLTGWRSYGKKMPGAVLCLPHARHCPGVARRGRFFLRPNP